MWSILSTTALFVLASSKANAAISTSDSLHRLQQHLSPDPGDVLENLSLYDKLWIEVPKNSQRGSCVWSECGIDETDDAYLGDNRDGDEKWYQYRTQSFCANAAYSLYGSKKEESGISGGWVGCSKKHFINSFFTYGGADNLLMALGETPIAYYGGDGDDDAAANDDADNRDDANGDDANGDNEARHLRQLNDGDDANNGDDANDDDGEKYRTTTTNAICAEMDEPSDDDGANGDNEDRRNRQLNSGESNDAVGYSSSMGCSAEGNYIIAAYQSSSCDGNYFLEALDTFDEYNAQHSSIGCNNIWSSDDGANDQIYALLKQSWTCDLRLYSNSCPDPYGEKRRYEYALRTALHGGNPLLALKNEELRRPLRILAWSLLVLTLAILMSTYHFSNSKRFEAARGGKLEGFARCVVEDLVSGLVWTRGQAAKLLVWTRGNVVAASRMGFLRFAISIPMRNKPKSSSRSSSNGSVRNERLKTGIDNVHVESVLRQERGTSGVMA